MDFESGTVIADRYTIESELGKGGMGAVYLALDAKFDRKVALKIAIAAGGTRDVFLARFKREAKLGDLLGREKGFIRALDWGEMPGGVYLYLAMDPIEGGKALDLEHGSLSERLERFTRAAGLVAKAHARGVIHRDIKPANFLQAPDGSLNLADFGIGKRLGETDSESEADVSNLTATGVGMGTPRYMSPEQYEDAAHVDERADVYALGVMLFYVLTGEFPYPGRSPAQISEKVATPLELGRWVWISAEKNGDVDVFRLESPGRGYLRPKVLDVPAGLKVEFEVKDEGRQTLSRPWVVDAGTYFIRVTTSEASAETYAFSVSWYAEPDTTEPNGSAKKAAPVVFGKPQAVALYPIRDVDWYRFTVKEAGYVVVRFGDEFPKGLRLDYECFDAKGKTSLGKNWAWRLEPGDYTVRIVEHYGNKAFETPFDLIFEYTPEYDAGEPNDDARRAKPITFGKPETVALFPVGDVDWYRIEVKEPGQVTVHFGEDPEPSKRLNLNLGWYSANGKTKLGAGKTHAFEPGRYTLAMWDRYTSHSRHSFSMRLEFTPKK